MKSNMLVGLFVFAVVIWALITYVLPWWNTNVTGFFGFAGSYASDVSFIVLFMLAGYGLIRYGKGHKGLPS